MIHMRILSCSSPSLVEVREHFLVKRDRIDGQPPNFMVGSNQINQVAMVVSPSSKFDGLMIGRLRKNTRTSIHIGYKLNIVLQLRNGHYCFGPQMGLLLWLWHAVAMAPPKHTQTPQHARAREAVATNSSNGYRDVAGLGQGARSGAELVFTESNVITTSLIIITRKHSHHQPPHQPF